MLAVSEDLCQANGTDQASVVAGGVIKKEVQARLQKWVRQ